MGENLEGPACGYPNGYPGREWYMYASSMACVLCAGSSKASKMIVVKMGVVGWSAGKKGK